MVNKNEYGDASIKTMTPLEGIRKRLGMYVGSSTNEAVHHIAKELISNAIDEYINGHGNEIIVEVNEKENWIRVRDFGRGVPHGKMDEVFTKTHSSGKIKGENNGAYIASGGLNGVGAKVATATGKLEISSFRNGTVASNWYHYEEQGKLVSVKTKGKNGTEAKWTPDNEVFTDSQISLSQVKELLEMLAYISEGLTFLLVDGDNETSISKNGIETFLTDNITEKNILSPIMKFKCGDSYLSVEGAMVWTRTKGLEQSFVNYIPTSEGGTHITSLKTVLTREMNKFLSSDLKGDEIRKGWSYIISVKTNEEPVFKSQQKTALNMPPLNATFSQLYKEQVERILAENKNFFESLEDIITKERQKEAAVSQVRQVLAKAKSKANPLPQKLKPALNKQGAELFLTEGNSASSSLIQYRNIYTQAIMSLRGKPINCKKADLDKVLKNQEIQDMIVSIGDFGENFDARKCAYDKIIILADQDSDGAHIQLLLLTFFYEFYPQLIRDGKLYTIQTPLYVIKNGTKVEYCFSEKEMEEKRKKLSSKAIISRNKGLGEIEPELLAEFALSDKRKLVQFQMEDEERVSELLEQFMGTDAEYRREFVGQEG